MVRMRLMRSDDQSLICGNATCWAGRPPLGSLWPGPGLNEPMTCADAGATARLRASAAMMRRMGGSFDVTRLAGQSGESAAAGSRLRGAARDLLHHRDGEGHERLGGDEGGVAAAYPAPGAGRCAGEAGDEGLGDFAELTLAPVLVGAGRRVEFLAFEPD